MSANGGPPPPFIKPPDRPDRAPLAIGYMLGATFVFTCTSALSKWLIETYPIGEVLFSRVFVPLIGLAIVILPRTGLASTPWGTPTICATSWAVWCPWVWTTG